MPDVKYKFYLVGTFLVAACFMNKIDLRIQWVYSQCLSVEPADLKEGCC